MNVSLARRKLMNEPSRYGGATADHSTSGVAVRRLGRIIQRIFLPNQEAALVERLLPRGFFHLLVVVWHFISLPDVFPPGPTNCPLGLRGSSSKSHGGRQLVCLFNGYEKPHVNLKLAKQYPLSPSPRIVFYSVTEKLQKVLCETKSFPLTRAKKGDGAIYAVGYGTE